jgi:hypothetical protein
MSDYLILNFEGEEGAITWVEEAQGLSVSDSLGNPAIDTSQHYLGNSSVKLIAQEDSIECYFDYTLPTSISDDFSFTSYFRFNGLDSFNDYISIIYGYDTNGGDWFEVYLIKEEELYLGINVQDGNYISFVQYKEINTLSENVWHKLQIELVGRSIVFKINNEIIVSGTSETENPLNGINLLDFYLISSSSPSSFWLDSVYLTSATSGTENNIQIISILDGINGDIQLKNSNNKIIIFSELESITSEIILHDITVNEQIVIHMELVAKRDEDFSFLFEITRISRKNISLLFEYVPWNTYNYQNISIKFEVINGDSWEDVSIIFNVIKTPVVFSTYIMQKLYCSCTDLTGIYDMELLDWNVKPNQIWYVKVSPSGDVFLYETSENMVSDTNIVAKGTADSNLQVVLLYQTDDSAMGYYYQDMEYHLSLSELPTSERTFKVKFLTDLSEINDPIYTNSNIVKSRGESELNLHTHLTINKELTLATHLPEIECGDIISFSSTRRGFEVKEQVMSNTIESSLSDDGETYLINVIKTATYKEIIRR